MSKASLFPCVLSFIDAFDRLLPEEREQVVAADGPEALLMAKETFEALRLACSGFGGSRGGLPSRGNVTHLRQEFKRRGLI